MTTLVDSNVILDLVGETSAWTDWSASGLYEAKRSGRLLVNDIIYAEVSIRFGSSSALDDLLDSLMIEHEPIGRAALFAAGQAHRRYRDNKGVRVAVLPDFIIGAHAENLACPLLTRDVRRYRTYFPAVRLITP